MAQGRYWLGTLFNTPSPTELADGVVWLKGQREVCPTTGREHVQLLAGFSRAVRLAAVKRAVGEGHWELTRSVAAEAYVWKLDTRVADSQFEIGARPISRARKADWDQVRELAKRGSIEEIPADIYIRYYRYFLI